MSVAHTDQRCAERAIVVGVAFLLLRFASVRFFGRATWRGNSGFLGFQWATKWLGLAMLIGGLLWLAVTHL